MPVFLLIALTLLHDDDYLWIRSSECGSTPVVYVMFLMSVGRPSYSQFLDQNVSCCSLIKQLLYTSVKCNQLPIN